MIQLLSERGLVLDIQSACTNKGFQCKVDGGQIHVYRDTLQYILQVTDGGAGISRYTPQEGGLTLDRRRDYSGEDGTVEAAIDLLRAILRH